MHRTEVDQLYSPDRTEYPQGCEYNFSANGHELRLFYANPTHKEINAIRKGKANFGLFAHEQIIFLLWQFKPMLWSDAPYCYWVVPPAYQANPEPIAEGEGALLQVVLINAATGIVDAIRAIGLDTDFSNQLHEAIRAQITAPISAQEYSDRVERAYAQYPTTLEMLRAGVQQ